MEQWILWEPLASLKLRFYVDELKLLQQGLVIKLSDDHGLKRIELTFKPDIRAYRYINDSFSLYLPAELNKQHGDQAYKYRFFKVINSSYVQCNQQILKVSASKYSGTHFCIIGADEMVDVVTDLEPEIIIYG